MGTHTRLIWKDERLKSIKTRGERMTGQLTLGTNLHKSSRSKGSPTPLQQTNRIPSVQISCFTGRELLFHPHGTTVSSAWNKSFTRMKQLFHRHGTSVSPRWNWLKLAIWRFCWTMIGLNCTLGYIPYHTKYLHHIPLMKLGTSIGAIRTGHNWLKESKLK